MSRSPYPGTYSHLDAQAALHERFDLISSTVILNWHFASDRGKEGVHSRPQTDFFAEL